MKTYEKIIVIVTFASWVGVIIYTIILAFYPFETLTYKDEKFPIIKRTLKEGDYIEYFVDYCRFVDSQFSITREIVGKELGIDGGPRNLYTYPLLQTRFPRGCNSFVITREQVPPNIPPGEYYLLINIEVPVNVLQTQYKTRRTESFFITN